MGGIDYTRICFVIMPFGKKTVGDRDVDFNDIYDRIFHPAISAVKLPEGGMLEPRRTDKDFFTGDIKQDMFEYLEYSRFALADISGLNFNVAYELGTRHRARDPEPPSSGRRWRRFLSTSARSRHFPTNTSRRTTPGRRAR